MKRAHPVEYESNIKIERVKGRWSSEEKRLVALKEAQLVISGTARINEELQKSFPNRTVDAIKSQRRSMAHKKLVQDYVEEMNVPVPSLAVGTDLPSQDILTKFQDAVSTFGTGTPTKYKEQILDQIWMDTGSFPIGIIKDRLTLYMKDVFPDKCGSQRRKSVHTGVTSRRQRRHLHYKETQFLFKKSRARCISNILQPTSVSDDLPAETVISFWQQVITEDLPTVSPMWDCVIPELSDIWEPVTLQELKNIKIKSNSAPGPDGITMKEIKCIPASVLGKIFNLFLFIGEVPVHMLRSRTIFIPKGNNVVEPSGLRPISVTSGLLRLFHRILAARLMASLKFDSRQTGFLREDGCASNILTLETLIKYQRSRIRDFFLSSLDLSKAFDSVTFPAIVSAAKAAGLPAPFLKYINFVLSTSTTQLCFKDKNSDYIRPTKGVRQGDPLSPILFNLVIDQFLKNIPDQIGVDIGELRFSALAYADDILLMSTTVNGMQMLLDRFMAFLAQCGLRINVSKSFGVALRASGRDKKIKVDPSQVFLVDGRPLPMRSTCDTWRYLGVNFSPNGRVKIEKLDLRSLLDKLNKAPLKPQQKLYALCSHVIPKFIHELTLGHVYAGFLTQLDQIIRQTVRKWLDLPLDAPIAYFHAGVLDGGLGITSFRWKIPPLKAKRLRSIAEIFREHTNIVDTDIHRARNLSKYQGTYLQNRDDVLNMWKARLYERIDAQNLKESSKTKGQHQWISDGTGFFNAKDFVNCVKLRINALPVRARTTRGRNLERQCRAGCSASETLNHVLQICHRTHDFRVSRHDNLVDYLKARLEYRKFVVLKEHRFQTGQGSRVPDLVAVIDDRVHVIDAQVVGVSDINSAHRRKVNYYKSNAELLTKIAERFNTTNISVHSLTLNYCGVWSSESAKDLLNSKILQVKDIKIISTRALIGGVITFRGFGRMTSVVRRVRSGVV